jgi:flagellar hook assembly protein FlgD
MMFIWRAEKGTYFFDPQTAIEYQSASQQQVNINIYNIKGQLVTELLNEKQDAVKHYFTWFAESEPSSVNLLRFTARDRTRS